MESGNKWFTLVIYWTCHHILFHCLRSHCYPVWLPADVAVRQDGVPVRVHGAGHPAAQRPAVDPGRRVHRQVLHRVRRRQPPHRLRARRLGLGDDADPMYLLLHFTFMLYA